MTKYKHRSIYMLKQQLGRYFRGAKHDRERITELEAELATLTTTLEEECAHHNRTKAERDKLRDACQASITFIELLGSPDDEVMQAVLNTAREAIDV